MIERPRLSSKTSESKNGSSVSQIKKTNLYKSDSSPIDQILFLQRTIGNRALEGLLRSGFIQAKLSIGQPGDMYEQEADRMADHVMRMPGSGIEERKRDSKYAEVPSIQSMCSDCEEELHRQPVEEEKELLQTKEVSGETTEVTQSVETQIKSVDDRGEPLSESVRAYFEPRFGRDFSQVRVHTDSKASESAQKLSAKAYTVGRDIVFGAGQYAPNTGVGKKLIAHELAHTVQQSRGVHRVQRFVECLPITMAITKDDDRCPKRVRGEISRARSGSMFLWELKNPSGWLVDNFAIGSSSIKNNLESNQRWSEFKENMVKQTDKRWEILGFSDCSGEEGKNKTLRKERALAVFSILPESVQKRIDNAEDAFIGDCIVGNNSEVGRSLNRSAFIRTTGITFPSKEITVQPPKPKPKPEAQTVDCYKSERDQLSRAYPIAIEMAGKALDLMKGGSTPERKALLEKYFNDSGVSTTLHVRAGFISLLGGIKTSFKFECEHKGEWFYNHFCEETKNSATTGYVRPYTGFRVHLCEAAFGRGDKFLAKVIVHECSHMFDFTDDEEYCSRTGCSKSLSRWDAYDNADSYAWFAFEAFNI